MQQNDQNISSMGVTFCLANSSQSFNILFTGGVYDKHRIEAYIFGKDKKSGADKHYQFKEDWWLRKSVSANINVQVADFDITKKLAIGNMM